MSTRRVAAVLAVAAIALTGSGRIAAQKPTPIKVYKTPTCGCCGIWVEHLRRNGFAPDVTDLNDLTEIAAKYRVPDEARSCHTAIVDGYVVEGHVPATEIRKLLKQRPAALGISAPGMPPGSPGMESPAARPYDVVTFDKTGKLKVFSTVTPMTPVR